MDDKGDAKSWTVVLPDDMPSARVKPIGNVGVSFKPFRMGAQISYFCVNTVDDRVMVGEYLMTQEQALGLAGLIHRAVAVAGGIPPADGGLPDNAEPWHVGPGYLLPTKEEMRLRSQLADAAIEQTKLLTELAVLRPLARHVVFNADTPREPVFPEPSAIAALAEQNAKLIAEAKAAFGVRCGQSKPPAELAEPAADGTPTHATPLPIEQFTEVLSILNDSGMLAKRKFEPYTEPFAPPRPPETWRDRPPLI